MKDAVGGIRWLLASGMLTACVGIAGCEDASAPYVAFDGGGFIFNYRIAEATYGVNLKPMRRLPAGAVLEVAFENPAGGAALVVRQPADGSKLLYSLQSPPVQGVVADRDYQVKARVIDAVGKELGSYVTHLRSTVDQSVLPTKPLVIGPFYTANPDAKPR